MTTLAVRKQRDQRQEEDKIAKIDDACRIAVKCVRKLNDEMH